jgi:3-phenylpropionate/trans-cinnamate dioxygenase ferredoxin subunit
MAGQRKWITVFKASEVKPGQHKNIEIEGDLIAVFNLGGKFHAIANVCTHDGGILTGGELNGKIITCPRHGAQFDITNGDVLRMPAFERVPSYEVRVEGDDVRVLYEN